MHFPLCILLNANDVTRERESEQARLTLASWKLEANIKSSLLARVAVLRNRKKNAALQSRLAARVPLLNGDLCSKREKRLVTQGSGTITDDLQYS